MIRTFFTSNAYLRALLAPRKPRHPLLRLALGLIGLVLLSLLVFVGVFVGAAMLAAGMAYRLARPRQAGSRPHDPNVVEGEYAVVRKSALPLSH